MLEDVKKKIRKNPLVWRWYLNRKGAYNYLWNAPKLEKHEQEITQGLLTNGIWKGDASLLLPQELIDALFDESNILIQQNTGRESDKSYVNKLLHTVYDADSIYAKVAENPSIKRIVQSYYKMSNAKLAYYNIWENSPSGEPPKNAQLWHRDRDDLKILKGFIYLTDVNKMNGAFCYAPGTQLDGKIRSTPDYFMDGKVARSNDEQMDKVLPKEKWIDGAGKKGTLVLTDTHGYHKGGYVQEGVRRVFVFMYLSGYSGRVRFQNL